MNKPEIDLFTCNHCNNFARSKIQKIVVYDLANILCFSCEAAMMDEIKDIARRYLGNRDRS